MEKLLKTIISMPCKVSTVWSGLGVRGQDTSCQLVEVSDRGGGWGVTRGKEDLCGVVWLRCFLLGEEAGLRGQGGIE